MSVGKQAKLDECAPKVLSGVGKVGDGQVTE
jgi:hypothetical protein